MTPCSMTTEMPKRGYDPRVLLIRGQRSEETSNSRGMASTDTVQPILGMSEGVCLAGEPAAGFLLLALDLKPIYANAEALQILAYPDPPESMEPLDGFVSDKIRSVLCAEGDGVHYAFAAEFLSGRRRYACRAFSLTPHSNTAPDHPALAVVLERSGRLTFDASQVAKQFHLTPREQETLRYLTQGLTNKEIGHRMNISPNTVKAFLKLIMMKMGVSTRSGIIGRTMNLASS